MGKDGNGPVLGVRDGVLEAGGWEPVCGSGVRLYRGLQGSERVGVSKGWQQGRGEKLQVGILMKMKGIYPCFLKNGSCTAWVYLNVWGNKRCNWGGQEEKLSS